MLRQQDQHHPLRCCMVTCASFHTMGRSNDAQLVLQPCFRRCDWLKNMKGFWQSGFLDEGTVGGMARVSVPCCAMPMHMKFKKPVPAQRGSSDARLASNSDSSCQAQLSTNQCILQYNHALPHPTWQPVGT